MTLMPVSNISVVGVRSSTRGASWWMPRRSTSLGSSAPRSIGSPSRLKIRPSVASPTGTVIGPPVSITSGAARQPVGRVHRDGAHAVVAEVLLNLAHQHALAGARADPRAPPPRRRPMACAIVIAWLISGRRSGKTASITTPWISSMRPTLRSAASPLPD